MEKPVDCATKVICLLSQVEKKDAKCAAKHFSEERRQIFLATPMLSEDKVKQCVDPKLKGSYPNKAYAKVWLKKVQSFSKANEEEVVALQQVDEREGIYLLNLLNE